MRNFFTLIIFVVLLSSCASKKDILYYQNIQNTTLKEQQFDPIIKSDDNLMIIVSAPNPEAAAPYNLTTVSIPANINNLEMVSGQDRIQTYLVDRSGFIQMPNLGSIKVGGLTRTDVMKLLIEKLKVYIKEPIVNLRITNYKIAVQGEVARPGVFKIDSERITLPEAIAMAGEMTIYGNRKNVLIIREIDGVKTHSFIDLTNPDFINSEYYYLTQNDLVVIEPNKARMNASVVGPNISVILSSVSLLITVIALLLK